MIKERLLQPDAQEKGWLLDGYPTSCSEAMALETLVIRPNIFILLDVQDEIIVERVVERQLYPVIRKIYDLKYSLAENEEIASRLTQRFDDTEEKDGQYLRPSDPSYEQVFDSLALVARHTTLPLLDALFRWRESESPKGAHDASTYQKKVCY